MVQMNRKLHLRSRTILKNNSGKLKLTVISFGVTFILRRNVTPGDIFFMIVLLLIQKIIQLLLLMATGYVVVKRGGMKSEDSLVLSKLCLYVIMPCTIIKAFQIEYDAQIFQGLMFAVAAALAIHILLLILLEILKRIFHLNVVEEASIFYSNAGNLIIPLVSYIFGDEWVIYSSAFMSVQMFFMWTHGVSLFHKEKKELKKILLNLNLLSVILGLLLMLFHISLPEILNETLGSISSMIGPIAMLIAGMLAANMDFHAIFKNKNIYIAVALRLLVIPGILLLVIKGMVLANVVVAGDYILLIVFLASMTPSASSVVQLSQVYGHDAEYAGAIHIVSTLACMLTMPIWVMLYLQ